MLISGNSRCCCRSSSCNGLKILFGVVVVLITSFARTSSTEAFQQHQPHPHHRTTTATTSQLFHAPNKAPQHDVKQETTMDDLSPDKQERIKAFVEHQQNVPRIGFPSDVRSLVQYNHGYAVMSTNSKSNPGFPGGSVVGFAIGENDKDGRPVFCFSGMSSHTQDILANPKCSLTIADKNFKGAADGRVNLMGTCERLKDPADIEEAREAYLAKHPGAFWANFGDFFWYRMEPEAIRFVGGFARAGSVSVKEYKEASPDPIMKFGSKIAEHMNDDHSSATIAMVNHYVPGLKGEGENENDDDSYVKEAIINRVDSLGMDIKITRDPENEERLPGQPQQFKVRLPFPERVEERGGVKTAIVQMTQEAAKSASTSTAPAEEKK